MLRHRDWSEPVRTTSIIRQSIKLLRCWIFFKFDVSNWNLSKWTFFNFDLFQTVDDIDAMPLRHIHTAIPVTARHDTKTLTDEAHRVVISIFG